MIEIRHARRSSFISRKSFGCGWGSQQIICPPFWQGVPLAVGCPLGCSYCYLKLTLRHHKGRILIYSNPVDLLIQLKEFAKHHPGAVINFGETADSVAMDEDTGFLSLLREAMSELKEQKLFVRPLLITKLTYPIARISKDPDGTIFCWSITSPETHLLYETENDHLPKCLHGIKAPAIPEGRLTNARMMMTIGYALRLRIDPIIPPLENYNGVLESIRSLRPERVTLGTPRFFKGWANFADETGKQLYNMTRVDGADGRRRLPFSERLEIYRSFKNALIGHCGGVALCKETREMWQAVGLDWKNPRCNCIP